MVGRAKYAAAARSEFEPRQFSVTVSQPVFTASKPCPRPRPPENRVLSGRANLANTEQQVLLQAVQAYMQVVRTRPCSNSTATTRASLVDYNCRRRAIGLTLGEVTRTDVAQAGSRLQGAIADRIAAEGNLTASIAVYSASRRRSGADGPEDAREPARFAGQ